MKDQHILLRTGDIIIIIKNHRFEVCKNFGVDGRQKVLKLKLAQYQDTISPTYVAKEL